MGYRRAVDRPAVALVGPGKWGRHILRDLVALGAETIVLDRSGRHREEALAAGAAAVVDSVDALPDRVAGAVVATPTTTHAEVVERLLERPIAVFCEKPLTDDPAAAARIAAAAPDRVFVMHKWRYHPGIELLGHLARSEELGPVVGLRTTRIGWGNPHGDVDGIWVLASHDLSIALEVLGGIPEPRAAVAELVAQTATGLVALLGAEPWFALEISTASPVRRREIRLVCRDGVAILGDAYADKVAPRRRAGSTANRSSAWTTSGRSRPSCRSFGSYARSSITCPAARRHGRVRPRHWRTSRRSRGSGSLPGCRWNRSCRDPDRDDRRPDVRPGPTVRYAVESALAQTVDDFELLSSATASLRTCAPTSTSSNSSTPE